MFFLDECEDLYSIIAYIKKLVKIMQILVPILLIIWGSIDMLKGIMAGDEKKIVAARTTLIKRFGAALAVFLVPWIVNYIINFFGGSSEWVDCWKNSGDEVKIIYPDD